jgi:hypothetical protein
VAGGCIRLVPVAVGRGGPGAIETAFSGGEGAHDGGGISDAVALRDGCAIFDEIGYGAGHDCLERLVEGLQVTLVEGGFQLGGGGLEALQSSARPLESSAGDGRGDAASVFASLDGDPGEHGRQGKDGECTLHLPSALPAGHGRDGAGNADRCADGSECNQEQRRNFHGSSARGLNESANDQDGLRPHDQRLADEQAGGEGRALVLDPIHAMGFSQQHVDETSEAVGQDVGQRQIHGQADQLTQAGHAGEAQKAADDGTT